MNSCQLMSSIGPRQSAVHGVVCMIVLQSLTVGKGSKCTCLLPFFSQTNFYKLVTECSMYLPLQVTKTWCLCALSI